MSYQDGWHDCLEVIKAILKNAGALDEVARKVDYIHKLVKLKKFERIRHDLGAIQDIF